MTTGNEIIERFERFASPVLAESWDHSGLQVGNPDRPVRRVMTTLDVRPAVVEEAARRGVDFIFAHHPVMFKPARDLDLRNPQNQLYADLLAQEITVYAAHTNLDTANGGMNDWLAEKLNLIDPTPLVDAGIDPLTGDPVGMGRVGDLGRALPISEFIRYCGAAFHLKDLRLILPNGGDDGRKIRRVAILGGSGAAFYRQARAAGADAYLTGDVSYHQAQDIQESGLIGLDLGHHIEAVAIEGIASLLATWKQQEGWDFDLVESTTNTAPYTFVNLNGGTNND